MDQKLSRAEFLKMIIHARGIENPSVEYQQNFSDVTEGAWYTSYVAYALSLDMITSANTRFRPHDLITRAEATKILMYSFGLATVPFR